MAVSNRTPAFERVLYAVAADGDTWFQPTIAESDSVDYTAEKSAALSQCEMNSPQGEQVLGS